MIDLAAEAPTPRAALVRDDGLDLALIAISSPIGIEALPRDEALELIEAHLEGVQALPSEFAAWGPVALDGADPAMSTHCSRRGAASAISLPAGALAGSGPARRARPGARARRGAQAAAVRAPRPRPPRARRDSGLRRAALVAGADRLRRADAGGVADVRGARAPRASIDCGSCSRCSPAARRCSAERLASRGAPQVELRDPLTYYETSSYGPAAIELMARWWGRAAAVRLRPARDRAAGGRAPRGVRPRRGDGARAGGLRAGGGGGVSLEIEQLDGSSTSSPRSPSAGATSSAMRKTFASTSRSGTTRTSTPG